jgi:hypothetical protein
VIYKIQILISLLLTLSYRRESWGLETSGNLPVAAYGILKTGLPKILGPDSEGS